MQTDAAPAVSVPVSLPDPYWKAHAPRVRAGGAVLTFLYLVLFGTFSLPWVTVSCEAAQTRPLSGFDLALSEDPDIRGGNTDMGSVESDEVEDIMDAVNGLRRVAVILLALLMITTVCAGLLVVAPVARLARWMAVLGTMLGQGFVAFFFGGWSIFGADVHHHAGYVFAFTVAAVAALLSVFVALLSRYGEKLAFGTAAQVVGWWTAALVFAAVAWIALNDAAPALGWVTLIGGSLLWPFSAVLTLREPTLRSGFGMVAGGLPLAVLGGIYIGSA